MKGEQLFREGKYEEAIVELTKALTTLKDRFNNSQVKD